MPKDCIGCEYENVEEFFPTNRKKVKKVVKKGGSLASDLQNLAVPFAILLAKQGLESMFSNEKKGKSSSPNKKSKSKSVKTVQKGGDCGCSGVTPLPMMGGDGATDGAGVTNAKAALAVAQSDLVSAQYREYLVHAGSKKVTATPKKKDPKSKKKKRTTNARLSRLTESIDAFLLSH